MVLTAPTPPNSTGLPPPQPPDGFTQPNGLPAVPLVLGLVGHCDPRAGDTEVLRRKLTDLFQQLKAAYANTPLVLLSSLAEGQTSSPHRLPC